MPNGLNNWSYQDVVDVLREQGFVLNHVRGSHNYFAGHKGGKFRQVCVPFHGRAALKPRTLKGIMLQSGLPKETWLKR